MALKNLVLATTNQHKVKEFQGAFNGLGVSIEAIDSGFNCPETAPTFLGNAALKALAGAQRSGKWCLADDSGLCVNALGGEPGLFSARYFNEGKGIEKILERLTNSTDRSAFFVCALALAEPTLNAGARIIWQTENFWQGSISATPQGEKGFGYDPIFVPLESKKTAAQLTQSEKEQQSHRGQAVQALVRYLGSNNI